jgi:hypothetical protein
MKEVTGQLKPTEKQKGHPVGRRKHSTAPTLIPWGRRKRGREKPKS